MEDQLGLRGVSLSMPADLGNLKNSLFLLSSGFPYLCVDKCEAR